ncbi:MAG: hypothetical protein JWR61_3313 [Ferruginibacter sp.]|nr:hypothetical protein [Ferruginibacter sp.]
MRSVKSKNPFKSVIQISYDIIKTHSSKLKMETKENEVCTFKIQLPIG